MEKVESFIENFDKVLELRFRAQAEMLDERFIQVFSPPEGRGDAP